MRLLALPATLRAMTVGDKMEVTDRCQRDRRKPAQSSDQARLPYRNTQEPFPGLLRLARSSMTILSDRAGRLRDLSCTSLTTFVRLYPTNLIPICLKHRVLSRRAKQRDRFVFDGIARSRLDFLFARQPAPCLAPTRRRPEPYDRLAPPERLSPCRRYVAQLPCLCSETPM